MSCASRACYMITDGAHRYHRWNHAIRQSRRTAGELRPTYIIQTPAKVMGCGEQSTTTLDTMREQYMSPSQVLLVASTQVLGLISSIDVQKMESPAVLAIEVKTPLGDVLHSRRCALPRFTDHESCHAQNSSDSAIRLRQ